METRIIETRCLKMFHWVWNRCWLYVDVPKKSTLLQRPFNHFRTSPPKKSEVDFSPNFRYKNALNIENFHHFLSNVTFKTFPVVGKLYDWPDGLWPFGSFQSFARRWGWFCLHETEGQPIEKVDISHTESMVMVYLPTWMVDFYGFHVGKHTVTMDSVWVCLKE